MSQVKSGKAFEYGMIWQLENIIKCNIEENKSLNVARSCYLDCTEEEQNNILKASDEILMFLLAHDSRLSGGRYKALLQSDMKGKYGDVRDVIIYDTQRGHEIGLSLKNRHTAVKHSRLSENIDFGKKWLNIPNTQEYKNKISPIFRDLRIRKDKKEFWRNINDKEELFYLPILYEFVDEVKRLYQINNKAVSEDLLRYLLGKYDFYKIVKENGCVSIQSFSIFGSLKWGKKIPLPEKIIEIALKEKSRTTVVIVFDKGWQISFRIHNAKSRVEPSLKFDIQIVGSPSISRHEIEYKMAKTV